MPNNISAQSWWGQKAGGVKSWWGQKLVGSKAGGVKSWWGQKLVGSKAGGVKSWWGQTEFQVNLKLGLTPCPPEAGGVVYPVWFGTNRKPNARGDGFTGERHDRVSLGRVEVIVPEAHRFGEIGSSLMTRLWRFDLRDDRLRVQQVETRERKAFFAEIQQVMQAARDGGDRPHALVFLHGFNVSFEEAAIRAAQIGFDLKVTGATAFFSWPSRGSVAAYPADEASIEASEEAITQFLVDFTAHCGAEKVHLIAHSMGNRGLLRSLQRIASDASTQGKVKFGQVFLAAPDVDRDLFLDLARLYPEHAERTTLYASDGDLAVHLSAKLHDAPRAGYYIPYTVVPGLDTVAVPDFDIDRLGHGYFAQAEALLHDIVRPHAPRPASGEAATDRGRKS
jgi:esterase/lipase superfamily enzyme